MEILFYIETILSILFSFIVAFYIPGRILVSKSKLNPIELIISSVVIGIVLWLWQGLIFGYLQIRWASYIYLLVCAIFYFYRKHYQELLELPSQMRRVDFIACFLLIVGVSAQIMPYIQTGFITSKGMIVGVTNTPDHIWQLALTNEIVTRFPPFEPGMYGVFLKNYHYGFNVISAELIRVFHLPSIQLQFVGTYVLASLLLGGAAYVLSKSIYPSKWFLRWLLFFFYFGGDAIYWLTYIIKGKFLFINAQLEDGTMFLDNPPRAYSSVVVMIAIALLFTKLKQLTKRDIIIISLLFGSAIGFKVYTGIIFLICILVLAVYRVIKERKIDVFLIFLISVLFAAAIFLPVNADSGGLIFIPFELPRDFIAQYIFGLSHIDLAWRIFMEHKNYIRLTEYGIIMSAIYLLAQFSLKFLIGIFPYHKSTIVLSFEKTIFVYAGLISALAFGIFSYQQSGTANVFSFFISASFFLTIIASLNLTTFLEKKNKFVIFLVIAIVFGVTIPRWVEKVMFIGKNEYFNGFHGLPNEVLEGFNFLKNKSKQGELVFVVNDGNVSSTTFQEDNTINGNIDSATPLVNAFTGSSMYMSGIGISDSHGVLSKKRFEVFNKMVKTKSYGEIDSLLKENNIKYVFEFQTKYLGVPDDTINVDPVFSNSLVKILQVKNM